MKKLFFLTLASIAFISCAALRCDEAPAAPSFDAKEQLLIDELRQAFNSEEVAAAHKELAETIEKAQALRLKVETILQAIAEKHQEAFKQMLEKYGAQLPSGERVLPIDNFYLLKAPAAVPAA